MQQRVKLKQPNKPKRKRRTNAEMQEFYDAIYDILSPSPPMTCRQIYYQLEVKGIISKDEKWYGKTTSALRTMRRSGRIAYDWIADAGRGVRQTKTYSNIHEMMDDVIYRYRLDAMRECSDVHLQIWLEKNALASIFWPVCAKYDVPLVVTIGTSSLPQAGDAAELMKASDKPCIVYHFADFDPTGWMMTQAIKNQLQEDYQVDCEVIRVGVTPDLIETHDLPTRPTKVKGNTHAKAFEARFGKGTESCELDALPPDDLRELLATVINKHISPDALKKLRKKEDRERAKLKLAISKLKF